MTSMVAYKKLLTLYVKITHRSQNVMILYNQSLIQLNCMLHLYNYDYIRTLL